jgi:hypothetical protein
MTTTVPVTMALFFIDVQKYGRSNTRRKLSSVLCSGRSDGVWDLISDPGRNAVSTIQYT